MTILIAALQALRSIFLYFAQRQKEQQTEEVRSGIQSKREHSLLLKALKARRRARQQHGSMGALDNQAQDRRQEKSGEI